MVVLLACGVPYAVVPAAVAAVLFAIAGSRIGALGAVGLLIVVVVTVAWPFIASGRRGGEPVLTIMTHNVLVGRGDPARILEVARRGGAQVVALQETTAECIAGLKAAGMDEEFPHSVLAPAEMWNGVALWSRFPLRDVLLTTHGELRRISARVAIDPARPDLDPTVICLHIDAPWPNDPHTWVEQLAELREDLRTRTGPVIALGDYNATLDHRPFRELLSEGCTDAVVVSRHWWTRTWPGVRRIPTLICIDHVISRGLRAASVSTARVHPSDHTALIARLARE